MTRVSRLVVLLAFFVAAAADAAQTPSPGQQPKGQSRDLGRPTKHDDELPLFDFDAYFLGRWTFEWDTPESPLGPADRIEGVTTYSKVGDGAYKAVTEATAEQGKVTITETIRYEKAQKTLTREVVDSRGYAYQQKGTIGGDLGGFYNIFFESAPFTVKGKAVQLKHAMRLSSPLNYRVTTSIAVDDGPFTNYGTPWWRKE